MRNREIKVTRNYSFWKHPIKWFKDRRKIALMDMLANREWENGLKEEVYKTQKDILYYGRGIFNTKTKKRVDPNVLSTK